jgi:tetratricopeptide (TPR) repeat protein
MLRGSVATAFGQYDAALKDLNRVLEIDPNLKSSLTRHFDKINSGMAANPGKTYWTQSQLSSYVKEYVSLTQSVILADSNILEKRKRFASLPEETRKLTQELKLLQDLHSKGRMPEYTYKIRKNEIERKGKFLLDSAVDLNQDMLQIRLDSISLIDTFLGRGSFLFNHESLWKGTGNRINDSVQDSLKIIADLKKKRGY